jgi:exonuclease III
VRGINSQTKLSAIWSKIIETKCDIISLQETKKETFDQNFIRQFCPPTFDHFEYVPSVGSLGGTIIIWLSSRFSGQVISQNEYAMSVEFESMISSDMWVITNVYAPCSPEGKVEFLNWLHDAVMPDDTDWLLVGDFNLIRRPSDSNRPGGILISWKNVRMSSNLISMIYV